MLIVQKFGGSSLADTGKLAIAAQRTAEAYGAGHRIVTVVSAQGDTTDALLRRAHAVAPAPGDRELDALLSVGELVSAALLAMELEKQGLPAVSLSGWQMGLHTDGCHGNAHILKIDAARLRRELEQGRIVVAAGFQGVDVAGDVTTLGRGGSDTTAVALAAALDAARCRIYTDVDGIYTADPRLLPEAKKLDAVAWEEMLALAERGSQVLHDRCVALALERRVSLELLSAGGPGPGTLVGRAAPLPYTGVTRRGGDVSLVGAALREDPEVPRRMRAALARRGIPASAPVPGNGGLSLTVTVPEAAATEAVRALHAAFF